MQKYTLIFILFIIAAFSGFAIHKTIRQFNENNILSLEAEKNATPTPLILPNGTIIETGFSGRAYLILIAKIPNSSKISLIPNFKEKLIGEKLVEVNKCDIAINGGFYLGNEKPLGLFFTNGDEIGRFVKSSIANYFVWQDNAGDIRFVRNAPQSLQFTDFIFQTGPYIIPSKTPLRLVRDENARRSLLGKDYQGNLYFIEITTKENLVGGPYLSDIPVIFWNLKEKNNLLFEELVNLDGGSASFFYSKDEIGNLLIPSWAPIGSLLCVKITD